MGGLVGKNNISESYSKVTSAILYMWQKIVKFKHWMRKSYQSFDAWLGDVCENIDRQFATSDANEIIPPSAWRSISNSQKSLLFLFWSFQWNRARALRSSQAWPPLASKSEEAFTVFWRKTECWLAAGDAGRSGRVHSATQLRTSSRCCA